jgi:NAD(P)-dependent dehydrogenase (short-subunit alcohol dehydrogenase family)
MQLSSKTKIAVIAGGAGGIGRAVVFRLVEAGFIPVILDTNEAAGETIMAELDKSGNKADFAALDLTRSEAVQETFAHVQFRYRRIDVLINLAGGTLHAHPIQEFPLAEWLHVIDVNLKATFLCCQAALPAMKQQQSGIIVNTASNFGVTGSPTRTAYAAAKTGIIAFTKSFAMEVAPHGIRVNAIAPGLTATERVMKHYSQESWEKEAKSIPMRRTAQPVDIAEGVAFLVSDDSHSMTGQTVHVNGGLVLP